LPVEKWSMINFWNKQISNSQSRFMSKPFQK
jgi:hypothetical protein